MEREEERSFASTKDRITVGYFQTRRQEIRGTEGLLKVNSRETNGAASGPSKSKFALKPGFSLMNWIKLTKSGEDLSGTGGRLLNVTPNDLVKHKDRYDAWICLNGKVYNVTHYMDYHPGGWEELLKGAGKDATDIFNDIHRWVNYESMLKSCLVGNLKAERNLTLQREKASKMLEMASKSEVIRKPRVDFYQTDSIYVITVFTKKIHLGRENIIGKLGTDKNLSVLFLFPEDQTYFQINYKLEREAHLKTIEVVNRSGKAEIVLQKSQKAMWKDVGNSLEGNEKYGRQAEKNLIFEDWRLIDRKRVTHDTSHFIFEPCALQNFHFQVPIGHHVVLNASIGGNEISRSYTPVSESLSNLNYGENEEGRLHFLIKTYQNGFFSKHCETLEIGDNMKISDHRGFFVWQENLLSKTNILLMAAGTGFTPMVKIIKCCLRQPSKQFIQLIFFNKAESDIIWKDEIEVLQKTYEHFKCYNVLSTTSKNYESKRNLANEILKDFFKEANESRLVLICGPSAFNSSYSKIIKDLGVTDEEMFVF